MPMPCAGRLMELYIIGKRRPIPLGGDRKVGIERGEDEREEKGRENNQMRNKICRILEIPCK